MLIAAVTLLFTLLLVYHTGLIVLIFSAIHSSFANVFFIGFIILQAMAAWASLFTALGNWALVTISIVLLIFTFWRLTYIKKHYFQLCKRLIVKPMLLTFALAIAALFSYALAAEITLYDTGLYHTQAIKWIKEYAVVPGLGNLHGRFAFNSHFFISSALFTFELNRAGESILIYPLNASSMLVFLVWLVHLVQHSINQANVLKAITYSLMAVFCLMLYPSWLNSPSPDIISSILVMLAFIYMWEIKTWQLINLVFLTSIILTAIVIKLSSVFLGLLLIPAIISYLKHFSTGTPPSLLKRGGPDSYREGVSSILAVSSILLISILILTPFFIRNYYLSGYLVYPTTTINLFNPEWKIPPTIVEAEKLHIATWAKVPRVADEEVAVMQTSEWLPIWWQRKSIPFKILLLGNLLSLAAFVFLKKKEALLFGIVWLNLLFWFFTAPDPRFVHGFLIIGFTMGQGALLCFALSRMKNKFNFNPNWAVAMLTFMALVSALTIRENATTMLANQFIYPKPMASNTLALYNEPFPHAVPQGNNRCYNAQLPCFPEENTQLEMRALEIKSGFRLQRIVNSH